jgi:hypothetical protein
MGAAFVGSTGPGYSLPFFSAGTAQHVGAGFFYHKRLGRLQLSSLAAFSGGQRTALQSVTYTARLFRLSGGGGLLAGQKTATGSFDFQPTHEFHFTALRQDLFWNNQRAAINSASGFVTVGWFTAMATALAGRSAGRQVAGQSGGIGARFGFLNFSANIYQSNGQRLLTQSAAQTFRHWNFQQSISESNGQRSFSGGAGYSGNKFSASFGHSIEFLPFAGRNFQQVTNLTLAFRIPHTDTAVNLATTLLPSGPLYTVGADSFTHGPFNVQAGQRPMEHAGSNGGKFLVRGTVVDKSGMPVSGAAVSIGGRLVFSDTNGAWLARFTRQRACNRGCAALGIHCAGRLWRDIRASQRRARPT